MAMSIMRLIDHDKDDKNWENVELHVKWLKAILLNHRSDSAIDSVSSQDMIKVDVRRDYGKSSKFMRVHGVVVGRWDDYDMERKDIRV
jgi:hypothetical protein